MQYFAHHVIPKDKVFDPETMMLGTNPQNITHRLFNWILHF